jgi:NAD(P) transhydrogenase
MRADMTHFELIVIGAGPAGQKAALQAAKLHRRVAIVEREATVGGACVSTGTLPSKTLRETVHYMAGLRRRDLIGPGADGRGGVTMAQLLRRKSKVIDHEIKIIEGQLSRNGVEVVRGEASFVDQRTISVRMREGMECRYSADRFIIATGSRPASPDGVATDDPRIIDSDTVLDLDSIPHTLTILGGGVIGCEYACVFATLGSKVTIIDRRTRLLRFLDAEITDSLAYHMRSADITLKLGEDLQGVECNGTGRVHTHLKSGKVVSGERLFCSMGRLSNVEALGLDRLNLNVSETGLVTVNADYQTEIAHIYAVGDVIGFPALASTSMEQGRLAACHAFGEKSRGFPQAFPYGIYTIPEISYSGQNEEELTAAKVPYEVGRATYNETARGQILGDHSGMLKLLFHRETMELLGVHIIGESATELIHIGQAVIAHGGKVTYFIDNVFNYPTLAECYKVAALNGVNRL